jgi:phage shock protein A
LAVTLEKDSSLRRLPHDKDCGNLLAMLFQDVRLRLHDVLGAIQNRADGLRGKVQTAVEIIDDVARYAGGRLREEITGEPADPVAKILNAFIIEAGNELIEGKKVTAMVIADEKRLAKQVEMEFKHVEEWERRAIDCAQTNDDALAQEARARKQEHAELVEVFRQQWNQQKELSSNLKATLRRLNQVLEQAKRTKYRLGTRRFARRAEELKKQVDRMDQIVKGLELLNEFDQSKKPAKHE